ncbi:MAG: hypothetical protein ACI8X3_002609 [Saprospiraceae bacterium]|jgi:uncharacterized protein (DUF1800 family)
MVSTPDKIKHLYWRSGFGLSPIEWENVKDQSLRESLDQIFLKSSPAHEISGNYENRTRRAFNTLDKEERKVALKQERQLVLQQNVDWVIRMADPTESALLEKMCLFWHGHFACISKGSKLAYQQLNTIRAHALGNFKAFVHAMAKDVSMIRFLNNQQNRKQQPNENFARELMELFTIGHSNYTEQDIKEAARAFTGWSSDQEGDFKFKKSNHDYSSKTFMGQTGNFDGGDIIDIILSRKETAQFITRKIYRFFVNDRIDEQHVAELSTRFYNAGYDIKDLMFTIFSADWFYESKNIGVKIKSPVVLLAGVMRCLHVRFDGIQAVIFIERALGQVLFNPPNVAGWLGGKNWIDNSTLMLRLNFVTYLFQAGEVKFKVKEAFEAKKRNKAFRKIQASVDLNPLIGLYTKKNEAQIFDTLSNFLVQAPIRLDLNDINTFLKRNNKEDFIKTLALRLMSLPEYQVC